MSRSERFVKPPHALHVKRENRHLSIVERHLAMLRLEEEEKRLQMNDEKEIISHLMDFSNDEVVDEYGFPFKTAYQVADSVPDVYVPPVEEKKPEEKQVEPPASDD